MLFLLAIIPAIVLMVFIYKKDKKEKEPKKLLWGCFLLGIVSIAPALVIENIGEATVGAFFEEVPFIYVLLDNFVVVALAEEGCKYFMLKKKTWKNDAFNCTFDGIVYSVFVSLGFATLENILYVWDGGMGTAFLRMFTAVPLHAVAAVFMGYYYGLAKKAAVEGDSAAVGKNKTNALFVPIVIHGIYDFLVSIDAEIFGEGMSTICFFIWVAFVIVIFIRAFILVNKSSKNDVCFIRAEEPVIIIDSPEIVQKEE